MSRDGESVKSIQGIQSDVLCLSRNLHVQTENQRVGFAESEFSRLRLAKFKNSEVRYHVIHDFTAGPQSISVNFDNHLAESRPRKELARIGNAGLIKRDDGVNNATQSVGTNQFRDCR